MNARRLVRIGKRPDLRGRGHVLVARHVPELGFDLPSQTASDLDCALDELGVLLERQSRPIRHDGARSKLERRLDQPEVGDVVELDAGGYRSSFRDGPERRQQEIPAARRGTTAR